MKKVTPSRTVKDLVANDDFASDDDRNESLHKVPEFVVIVSLLAKLIPDPFKHRNLGVGVVAADHEDDAMNQNQDVCKLRQRIRVARIPDDGGSQHGRKHFEKPGWVIMRIHCRPDEGSEKNRDPGILQCSVLHSL